MSEHSQFRLLGSKRFLPFFTSQLLGAFNDNLFKQALILAILFKLSFNADRDLLINLSALLFILPFFLFSALGGQFGEKFDKDLLIRRIKLGEVAIMLLGALGLWLGSLPLLLVVLFAMGTQSALFGPVKYSILCAGILMASGGWASLVGGAVVLVAIGGYLAARRIPSARAGLPDLAIDWNIFRQSWAILRLGLKEQVPSVSRSILGNSWFWFLGATYLTQIPGFAKDYLHGDESVVTLILTVFSVGIALGSVLCERLSGHKVEIGLVPFGSFGLSVFGLLIWSLSGSIAAGAAPYDWLTLLAQPGAWGIMGCILGLGVFGGFYIVPLYALIQSRSREEERARVIAANNILNALLMVCSAILAIVMLSVLELSIPTLFLTISLLNVLVNGYIFKVVPEFSMRFLIWLLGHSMYRVEHRNLEAIPDEGPCVLVCNHVSFVDALLIGGAVRRPVRFVMYYKIYRLPVLNFIFRTAGTVPIAGRQEDEVIYERAFERISAYLRAGEVVCIFPEGKLTADGEMDVFRAGITRILENDPVPVVPMALQGLWGSFFSRDPHKGFFRRLWSRVCLVAGQPVAPEAAQPEYLQEQVSVLRGERR